MHGWRNVLSIRGTKIDSAKGQSRSSRHGYPVMHRGDRGGWMPETGAAGTKRGCRKRPVWTAEKRSLQPFVESVGTLKAYEEVIVSSEVDGILKSIRVQEGSPVTQGQLIAEIKEIDYRLDTERAAVALKQAEASLAYAKQEYERKEALYRKDLVAKQQFDDVLARLVLSQGDVDRAKMGLDLAHEKLAKTSIYARWPERSKRSE